MIKLFAIVVVAAVLWTAVAQGSYKERGSSRLCPTNVVFMVKKTQTKLTIR